MDDTHYIDQSLITDFLNLSLDSFAVISWLTTNFNASESMNDLIKLLTTYQLCNKRYTRGGMKVIFYFDFIEIQNTFMISRLRFIPVTTNALLARKKRWTPFTKKRPLSKLGRSFDILAKQYYVISKWLDTYFSDTELTRHLVRSLNEHVVVSKTCYENKTMCVFVLTFYDAMNAENVVYRFGVPLSLADGIN